MKRLIAGCLLVLVCDGCARVREADEDSPRLQKPDVRMTTPSSPDANVANATRIETLRRGLSRSSDGLRSEPMSDGIRKVDLQGRFLHATVLDQREPGATRRVCVDHPSALAEMF